MAQPARPDRHQNLHCPSGRVFHCGEMFVQSSPRPLRNSMQPPRCAAVGAPFPSIKKETQQTPMGHRQRPDAEFSTAMPPQAVFSVHARPKHCGRRPKPCANWRFMHKYCAQVFSDPTRFRKRNTYGTVSDRCDAPSIIAPKPMTLAGLEPAIFGSEDQRLIH